MPFLVSTATQQPIILSRSPLKVADFLPLNRRPFNIRPRTPNLPNMPVQTDQSQVCWFVPAFRRGRTCTQYTYIMDG